MDKETRIALATVVAATRKVLGDDHPKVVAATRLLVGDKPEEWVRLAVMEAVEASNDAAGW